MTKVHDLIEKNKSLNHQQQDCAFSLKIMEANDNLTAFYTGLPSWVAFFHVYMYTCLMFPKDAPFLLWMNYFLHWSS